MLFENCSKLLFVFLEVMNRLGVQAEHCLQGRCIEPDLYGLREQFKQHFGPKYLISLGV